MKDYDKTEQESTDESPVPYVVFATSDYRVRGAVMARTWDEARELGARKLRVRPSVVWAVAVYEGETNEQAWRRGVDSRQEFTGQNR